MYIWQHKLWPHFTRSDSQLVALLGHARHQQGLLLGQMSNLGFDVKCEAGLENLTEDILKSSLIEGDILPRDSVRSSIARQIGIPDAAIIRGGDARTESIVTMMLDSTQNYNKPLTRTRLHGWQKALFPTGYSGLHRITTGAWRTDKTGPMQVMSGPYGRESIHFEAPPAPRLPQEISPFLQWFNDRHEPEGLLRAAIAHLWFVTIHPYDDGNGRIARAITDMALAQAENSTMRFYSMSRQIQKERNDYYDILEKTQKNSMDITPWLTWFLECFIRALDGSREISSTACQKAQFWQRHETIPFNPRQRNILTRVLGKFQGHLTAKKWATLGKCSLATAQRDINELVDLGILIKNPGGSKNTSYQIINRF